MTKYYAVFVFAILLLTSCEQTDEPVVNLVNSIEEDTSSISMSSVKKNEDNADKILFLE